MSFARFKYTGTTPGADSSTYTLFTTTGYGEGHLAMSGASKFVLNLKHSHGGTLNSYKSDDRGTNWRQLSSDPISSPASIGVTHVEYLVGALRDWKLEWVNGGTAQSPWVPDMVGMDSPLEDGAGDVSRFASLGAAATANAKAGAGNLYSITATNRNAAVRYLQLFDSTGATATVLYQWPVAVTAGLVIIGSDFFTEAGWRFSTGITWGMSTTAGSYVAATASETDVAGSYL